MQFMKVPIMDRLNDFIKEYGEAWFDDRIPERMWPHIDDIDAWTKENKGYNT